MISIKHGLKAKKICLLFIVVLLSASFVVSCSREGSKQETEEETKQEISSNNLFDQTYRLKDVADQKLKITGRHTLVPEGITWDWSASGMEWNALCEGDILFSFSSTGPLWFRVWINGEKNEKIFKGESGKNTFTIAENLARGEYTFKIAKMTDIKTSIAVMETLSFKGEFLDPPKSKSQFIEFVGDSLTCGTGIMDGWQTSSANAGGYVFMDATSTFAFQIANDFGFDTDASYTCVAGSHIAYSDKYENYLDIYDYVSFKRDATVWKNDRRADLVIVNLGTNDAYQHLNKTEFIQNLGFLLENLHLAHGENVKVLFVLNMVTDNYSNEIISFVAAYGGEHAGLYTVAVETDATGGANHASQKGHDKAAKTIADFIIQKELL